MYLIHDDSNGKRQIWASVENYGAGEVWEFMVYGLTNSGDPRTCPSLGMACELLSIDPTPILATCPTLASRPTPRH